jgi:methionyl aminopeptidase
LLKSPRSRIRLKDELELVLMRRSGRLVADTLRTLRDKTRPGVTTGDLDRWAESYIREHGGIPSFKGYRGFPASACISVNEQVVHGIPGERRLEEGDIVSIDVGAVVDGWHGDSAITLPVGKVASESWRLLRATYQALYHGIGKAQPGNRMGDISHAVQRCAEEHGFAVVREMVGHGIGRRLHEAPQIPNHGPPGQGPFLLPGMVLAIEPIVNLGGREVEIGADHWTVLACDGRASAHFEHTVAVGENGPEILTGWPGHEEVIPR